MVSSRASKKLSDIPPWEKTGVEQDQSAWKFFAARSRFEGHD
jgi:hypothetical protein